MTLNHHDVLHCCFWAPTKFEKHKLTQCSPSTVRIIWLWRWVIAAPRAVFATARLLVVLGEIALAPLVPFIATHFFHSVVCRLSHLCTLLKPLDTFRPRCHFASTCRFAGSKNALCQIGVSEPQRRRDFKSRTLSQDFHCLFMIYQVAASISYSAFCRTTSVFF